MNLQIFIDLVRQMREAQVQYFQTRGYKELAKAKMLEKRVDTLLADYRAELDKQAGIQLDLFTTG